MLSRRMRRDVPWLLALTFLVIVVAAGCGDSDNGNGGSSGNSPGASRDGGFDGTIKVGFNVEQSGPGSDFGNSRVIGGKVAVADINAQGGIKVGGKSYELKLIIDDNRTNPTYGVQNAQSEVQEDVLWAIPPDDGFEGAYEIYRQNDTILMANGGTASELLATDANAHPLLFFEFPNYDQLAETWLISVKSAYPEVKRLGVLLPDDADGQATVGSFERFAPKHGLELVGTALHPPEAQGDFSTFLTSLKSKNPDVIFLGYYPQVATAAAEQGAQLDAADVFFTDYVPEKFSEFGDLAGHPLVSSGVAWAFSDSIIPPDPKAQELAKRIDAEAGGESYVTSVAVVAYISDIMLVKEAIERAGTIEDRKAIAHEMLTARYDGPFGPAKVQKDHSVDLARSATVIDEKGKVTGLIFDSATDPEPKSKFEIRP